MMSKLTALAGALFLLCALAGCSSGWATGNGYYVEFGACESQPLGDRPTVTAEHWPTPDAPTATATPAQPSGVICVVVASGGLNVRNRPNGMIVDGVRNGDMVVVLEEDDDWRKIQKGWVHGDYLVCDPGE
jgi:uncharacterized protein YgiM (DUF1202 family)